MYDQKQGSDFLRKLGLLDNYRGPLPQLQPKQLKIHSYPLASPDPQPPVVEAERTYLAPEPDGPKHTAQ